MVRLPDFKSVSKRFESGGWAARQLAESVWNFCPLGRPPVLHLVLSGGVHGDEFGPLVMLDRLLEEWARDCCLLEIALTVAIGNLDALAVGKRFLRHDMNRMFGCPVADQSWGIEGHRAAVLRASLAESLQAYRSVPAIHLDLHTTIRPSLKPVFAIIPGGQAGSPLISWLDRAAVGAAVLASASNVTLSSYTASLGCASCTVELGQSQSPGGRLEDVSTQFEASVDRLVRQPARTWDGIESEGAKRICVYQVVREITRTSEQFQLLVPDDTPNFTVLEPGQLVARDRLDLIHAEGRGSCLLFPNANVEVGLRAGILVEPLPAVA